MNAWNDMNGIYRGTLQRIGRIEYKIELRLEITEKKQIVSWDLFRYSQWSLSQKWIASFICDQLSEDEQFQQIINGVCNNFVGISSFLQAHWDKANIKVTKERFGVLIFELNLINDRGAVFTFVGSLSQELQNYYREVSLEIDRIPEAIFPPTSMYVHDIPQGERPYYIENQEYNIEALYQKAGIKLTANESHDNLEVPIMPNADSVNDRLYNYRTLHRVMNERMDIPMHGPDWRLYLLIAPQWSPGFFGVMFDYIGSWGFSGGDTNRLPRQGCALFWEKNTIANPDLPEWERYRTMIYTAVHELGHAFNLQHCFAQGRHNSLSWMNYPWLYPYGSAYDPENQQKNFWRSFKFEFDEEELAYLHHTFRPDIIMGGQDFGKNSSQMIDDRRLRHEEFSFVEDSPLQLNLTTHKPAYVIGEPIYVQLKLKNLFHQPVKLVDRLKLWDGLVQIKVRHQSGRELEYRPLITNCYKAERAELAPNDNIGMADYIWFGKDGFLFMEPGVYSIKAAFNGMEDGDLVESNTIQIFVGYPQRKMEPLLEKLFQDEVGGIFYYQGLDHLDKVHQQLIDVTKEHTVKEHPAIAHIHLAEGKRLLYETKNIQGKIVRERKLDSAYQQLKSAKELAVLDPLILKNIEKTMSYAQTLIKK